ncbi:MAG TPA: hypothetical protein VNA68_02225 [Candidatus Dormibacteraeota bacterium]|nr:hypothetical protein [Candidatus Dormibacteraeota bacterium]
MHQIAPGRQSKNSTLNTALVVLLIVVSVVATIYLGMRILSTSNTSKAIKSKQYQALFLTNGQVYFGKLKSVDSSYVRLNDIYYLQVQQSVQPGEQKKEGDDKQPQVSLAKLGGELHGPEDVMYISRDQVLFWENLKDDGKVVTAIKENQSGKK